MVFTSNEWSDHSKFEIFRKRAGKKANYKLAPTFFYKFEVKNC